MDDVIEKHYIVYNNVTGRKYFFSEDTPFLKYYEMVNLPYFHNIPDSRVVKREYDESYAEAQRLSQNYRIQGSSADISKLAGIYLFQEILNRGWFNVVKIVNMIHDEYNVEAPEELSAVVTKLTVDCRERAADMFCKTVKLKAEPSVGKHWIH